MIWILLYSLIFGSSDSPLANTEFKKHVKKYVVDKDRKGEILDIAKDFKSEIKTLNKVKKKNFKELHKLNGDYNRTRQEMETVFNVIMESRMTYQNTEIDVRLKIAPLIMEEEWEQILDKSLKDWDKGQKKRDKAVAKLTKKLDKLDKVVVKKVAEKETLKKVQVVLSTFRSDLLQIQKAYHETHTLANPVIGNLNATREDLEGYYQNNNELRRGFYRSYLDARMGAHKLVSASEWKAISKSMNNVF